MGTIPQRQDYLALARGLTLAAHVLCRPARR